jgi:hypothetical protein
MTLTIELPQEVVDGLSRVAAEKQVTVEAVLQDLAMAVADTSRPQEPDDATLLRNVMTFGLRHGISGEGFDIVAAKHEGHRL